MKITKDILNQLRDRLENGKMIPPCSDIDKRTADLLMRMLDELEAAMDRLDTPIEGMAFQEHAWELAGRDLARIRLNKMGECLADCINMMFPVEKKGGK